MLGGTPFYATPSHFIKNDVIIYKFKNLGKIFHLQDWHATLIMIYKVITGDLLFEQTARLFGELRNLMVNANKPGWHQTDVFEEASRIFWHSAVSEFQVKIAESEKSLKAVAVDLTDTVKYMFGKSILVAPVTDPGVNEWHVYLPKSTDWYEFWTGQRYNGGQTIKTDAPLDKIPLYIKAGSILPMGKFIQYAKEKPADTLEIRIYRGADGQFDLYEDEGDNYNYEKGKYTIISFKWDEKDQTLTICKRQGSYPGNLTNRAFNVVLVSEAEGIGISVSNIKKQVSYTGTDIKIEYW